MLEETVEATTTISNNILEVGILVTIASIFLILSIIGFFWLISSTKKTNSLMVEKVTQGIGHIVKEIKDLTENMKDESRYDRERAELRNKEITEVCRGTLREIVDRVKENKSEIIRVGKDVYESRLEARNQHGAIEKNTDQVREFLGMKESTEKASILPS